MTREIILRDRDGYERARAVVDADVYDDVTRWNWHLTPKGYVARTWKARAHRGTTYLARYVMGLEAGDRRHVDHINHDKLDNRRTNLRAVTGAVNSRVVGQFGRESRPPG